jgi:hypothetical protein
VIYHSEGQHIEACVGVPCGGAGIEQVLQDVRELIEYPLRYPEVYRHLGTCVSSIRGAIVGLLVAHALLPHPTLARV